MNEHHVSSKVPCTIAIKVTLPVCLAAARRTSTNVPIALYSLLNVAPDDGLTIVRNMYSNLMKNKDYPQDFVLQFCL